MENQPQVTKPQMFLISEENLTNLDKYARKLPWETGDPIIQFIRSAFVAVDAEEAKKLIPTPPAPTNGKEKKPTVTK